MSADHSRRRTFAARGAGAALCLAASMSATSGDVPALHGTDLHQCSGLPCVDVTLDDGKHLRLMVDTGNVTSVLDYDTAQALGLSLEPVVGPDGKAIPHYWRTRINALSLGESKLTELKFLVVPMHPAVVSGSMPLADGTLAYTAFKERLLRLDYKAGRLELSEPLETDVACPKSCGQLTTPTFGRDGPPIVATTGFTVNGQPLEVQVDTLFAGTMLVYPSALDRLHLSAAPTLMKRRFPFTDGGVDMLEGSATEGFGDSAPLRGAPLYFATPAVHVPDGLFDGTVGHALLSKHVVTMDFRNGHFWLD